jgi:hypothetical protein
MAILWHISAKNILLRTALGLHFVSFIASAFANNEIDFDLGRFFTVKFSYFA